MEPHLYYQVAHRQDTYWWGRGRRKLSLYLLRRFGIPIHCRILELGCGPGQNLRQFEEFDPDLVVGADISPIALGLAKAKVANAILVQCDISKKLPFTDSTFEVVTIFNVLYHRWITNEIDVLVEAERILKPGGLLLLTEPAFSILSRDLDIVDMAARRYSVSDVSILCRRAGFDVKFVSYFTSFGFPIVLASKILSRLVKLVRRSKKPKELDMAPLHPGVNRFAYGLAVLEARIISAGLYVPFGTTLVCLARKRSTADQ